MKLSKQLITKFEADQASTGTKQALYNVIHKLAEEILRDIGVKHIKTANRVFGRNKGAELRLKIGDVTAETEHGSFQNMQQE